MTYEERVTFALDAPARPVTIEEFVADAGEMVSLVHMPTADQMRVAEFNPNEPRVPAGHPGGGQWTDDGSVHLDPIGPQSKDFPYEDQKFFTNAATHPFDAVGENVLQVSLVEQEDEFDQAVWGIGGRSAWSATEAKRHVEQLIGAHLEKQFTRAELDEMALLVGAKLPTDPKDSGLLDPALPTTRIANSVAGAIVQHWAVSSGDTHAWSVLMQDAIRQEFGLDDASFDHLAKGEGVAKAWDQLFLRPGNDEYEPKRAEQRSLIMRVFRAHARAQYIETQRELTEAGFEHLDLVRGSGIQSWQAFEVARTGRVQLQPASAFSLDFDTAKGFASANSGPHLAAAVIRTRVPRSRILSFPKTGFGCLNESEIVVLGGKLKTRIMYWL